MKSNSDWSEEYFNSSNQVYKSSNKKRNQNEKEEQESEGQKVPLKDGYREQLQNILYKEMIDEKKVKQTFNTLVYNQAKQRIKNIMGSNKEQKEKENELN